MTLIERMSIGFIALVLTLSAFILYLYTVWTDNNLEYVLTLVKGHYVAVPNWISVIVATLLGALCLPFNIIIEILKLVN